MIYQEHILVDFDVLAGLELYLFLLLFDSHLEKISHVEGFFCELLVEERVERLREVDRVELNLVELQEPLIRVLADSLVYVLWL
mmetsp:Transcript_5504/g.5030  ORF Transcript_5504/g.5030 Transcript_5504/m.5030 type:complete len:84 (-) Transcript_5504:23-274(-)